MSNERKTTTIVPKDTKGTPSLPKDKAKKTDKMSKKTKDAPKKKWKITPKKVVALVCGIICLVALIGFIVYSFTKENPPRYNEKYVYDGNSLVGTWREYEFDESFFQIYEFTRDKKVILKSYTYGIFDQELVGSYETSNTNTITISYSDKEKEQSSFSIDEGGRLVIYTLGEMGFEERALVKYDLDYKKPDSLLGTWVSSSNNKEEFEFFKDYTGVARNTEDSSLLDNFRFALKDNKMYMLYVIKVDGMPDIVSGGVMCFDYRLEGNTLTIYGNDANGNTIEQIFTKKN